MSDNKSENNVSAVTLAMKADLPKNRDKHVAKIRELFLADPFPHVATLALLECDEADLAVELLLAIHPGCRSRTVQRLIGPAAVAIDSPGGARLLNKILPTLDEPMYEDAYQMFAEFLVYELTYLAIDVIVEHGLDLSACRAVVMMVCEIGRLGPPLRGLWAPLKRLADALPDKRLDLRGMHPGLPYDFPRRHLADVDLLRDGTETVSETAPDYLLFPASPMSDYRGEPDQPNCSLDGGIGDRLVRLTELFRSAGVRVVMNESQRMWRTARYRLVCLAVAAVLKRLGLRSVRASFVARDLIAGWL